MGAIGVREALRGPWAFSARGWLVLFFPSTVLVMVQESAIPFPHFGYVLLTAVLQHIAAGIVATPAAVLLRRSGHRVPMWLSIASWTGIGLSRGLVGGLLASAVANVDADFVLRVIVWLLVSWIWLPLFTYAAAQSHNRRSLLASLDDVIAARDAAARMQERSSDDIREQLILAIQGAVNGAVSDIRTSLAAARSSLDPDQLRMLGDRLAAVSQQVGRLVDRLGKPGVGATRSAPRAGAPLLSALTFERRRPWLSSTLASSALAVVLGPLSLRVGDWSLVMEFGAAMVASTLILALGARIPVSGLSSLRRQVAWIIAHYGSAGLGAALVIAVTNWNNLDNFTTVLILILPYGVVFSAVVVSGAVGLSAANRQALRSLTALETERAEIEAAAADEENSIRDQLAEVMHGPVLGRLAACAMALNFHAAVVGTVPEERTADLAAAVAAHLDAATADLDSFAP